MSLSKIAPEIIILSNFSTIDEGKAETQQIMNNVENKRRNVKNGRKIG